MSAMMSDPLPWDNDPADGASNKHAHGDRPRTSSFGTPTNPGGQGPTSTKGPKPSRNAIQRLMAIAEDRVVPLRTTDGSLMAAKKDKPHLVYPLNGLNSEALVPVFLDYVNTYGKPAPKEAMNALRSLVEMQAVASEPCVVYQRAAWVDGTIWVDTGWSDGSAIRVNEDGWQVVSSCPVHFSRSQVTGGVPDPRGVDGNTQALKEFVHCAEEDLPLVWAVLVTTWFTDVPQPVFSVLGGADSGKSTTMRFLLDLVDPSTTQAGSTLSKDERVLKALAAARRVMCFDNVSGVDQATSDLLARTATGGEMASRALYTNDAAHITQLMRPVWLNGIMDGFHRGDLASRAVRVELHPVAPEKRVSVEELKARWADLRPAIFAGLLDLMVDVLARRHAMRPAGKHRNVEFERNLLTIDVLWSTSGAQRLEEHTQVLAETVLDGSTFGMVWRRAVAQEREHWQPSLFEGEDGVTQVSPRYVGSVVPEARTERLFQRHTTAQLMDIINTFAEDGEKRMMPQTTKRFGEELLRIRPQLESVLGVRVEKTRKGQQRYYVIEDLRR